MVLASEQARFSEEVMKGPVPKELPFINIHRYLAGIGIRVPEILYVDENQGVILLEDLGDATLERQIGACAKADSYNESELRLWYKRAIDLLVKLQTAAAGNPSQHCLAYTRAFDFDLMRWELDHFREYLLEIDRNARLTPVQSSEMNAAFEVIARELSLLPREFVHRDFQSRNLMVVPEGFAIIDFQDALLGPPMYDVVSLLRDSYIVLLSPLLNELVDYYLSTRRGAGLPCAEKAEFRRLVDLQTVQRKLKDAGRFVFIDRVKKNPKFLPNIPVSLSYAREALTRLPEFSHLQEILGQAVPELAR